MQMGHNAAANPNAQIELEEVTVDVSSLDLSDMKININQTLAPSDSPQLSAVISADGESDHDVLHIPQSKPREATSPRRCWSVPDLASAQQEVKAAAGEGSSMVHNSNNSDVQKLSTSTVICIVRELSNHLADLGPSHSAATLEREAHQHERREAEGLWRSLHSGEVLKVPQSTNALVAVTALSSYLGQLEDCLIPHRLHAAFLSVANSHMEEELKVTTLLGLLSVLPRPCFHVLQIIIPQIASWIQCFDLNNISLIPIWTWFLPLVFGNAFSEEGWVLQTHCACKLIECRNPLGLMPPEHLAGISSMPNSPRSPEGLESEAKFKSMPRVHQTDPDDINKKKYKVKKGVSVVNGTPSYEVMVNLKLGIKVATQVCHEARKNLIELKDFQVKNTESFPACGTVSTPPHDSRDFQFKDYCPNVFRQIREQYSITVDDYLGSICDEAALRQLGSPGKSGAVFYFSHDMKYLIKSVSKKESQFLRRILPYYYEHVMKHQNTSITLFYGLYCVKPHGMPNIRLVVMSNMFDMVVHEVYDVKGSTHGRITQDANKKVEGVVLKDLDLGFKVHTKQTVNSVILDQLQIDVQFLESMEIMDYSLLLGVHYLTADQYELDDAGYPKPIESTRVATPAMRHLQRKINAFQQDYGGTIATKSTGEVVILCFGVIDILQTYDGFKTTEHWCKRICIKKEAISVNDPVFYASRFKERMDQLFVYEPVPPAVKERNTLEEDISPHHTAGNFSNVVRIGSPDPKNPSRIKVQVAAPDSSGRASPRGGPLPPERVHAEPNNQARRSRSNQRVTFAEITTEESHDKAARGSSSLARDSPVSYNQTINL